MISISGRLAKCQVLRFAWLIAVIIKRIRCFELSVIINYFCKGMSNALKNLQICNSEFTLQNCAVSTLVFYADLSYCIVMGVRMVLMDVFHFPVPLK